MKFGRHTLELNRFGKKGSTMRLMWLIGILVIQITVVRCEYTIRDRIKLHKAWLERRAMMKAQDGAHNNTTQKLYYFDKLLSNLKRNNSSQSGANAQRKHKKFRAQQNEVIIDKDNFTPSTTILPTIANLSDYTTVYPIKTPFELSSVATNTADLTVVTTPTYDGSTLKTSKPKKDKTIKARRRQVIWGAWHPWSECSRTCGSGVMSQRRDCIRLLPDRNSSANASTVISKECIGLSKRYRLCNEQICPDPDVDFRQQQCMEYNNQTFQGTQYEWEAYVKDDAECELNCKPVGLSYFATLNDRVIDGTSCFKPSEYLKLRRNHAGKAICVDGICKVIHSNGVITGSFMNNGAVRCGDLICRPITGLFSKNPLPSGYMHVATIPAGSSNISITELKNSMNLLALSYSDDDRSIINGEHTVSLSGIYEAAGATFDYQRIDGMTNNSTSNYRKLEGVTEWITCTGRITEAIQLKVLSKDKNPGIKYEYLLPINGNFESNSDESYDYTSAETEPPPLTTLSAATHRHTLKSGTVTASPINVTRERRKRKFMWKVVDFQPCNKSCGGGIQTPIYHCVKEGPSKRFVPKRCAHLAKPILSDSVLKCNTQPCPAYWKISEWSTCQCNGNNDTGFQKREIKCVQELGTGMVIQIPNGACLDDKPDGRQSCECVRSKQDSHKYRVSQAGLNSIKHRGHHSKNSILNDDNNNNVPNRQDAIYRNKKIGVWLTSEWIEQCTSQCGEGVQYRSIFCDRSPPSTDRCDIRLTPDSTRQCTATAKCDAGEWFVASWNQCSGDCFNLTQTRTIYCIKNGDIVEDINCVSDLKPVGVQKCNISQVSECGPSWHYSEWSECSRPCGSGLQKRSIKCLSYEPNDGEMKESDSCKHKKRKRASQACNVHSCDSTTEPPSDPRVDLIQNDIAAECKDELPNCLFAVKQQLCNWPYIKEQCCETCFYKS